MFFKKRHKQAEEETSSTHIGKYCWVAVDKFPYKIDTDRKYLDLYISNDFLWKNPVINEEERFISLSGEEYGILITVRESEIGKSVFFTFSNAYEYSK